MSIYGDQWVCVCTWHNVFLRQNCRNCNAPRPLATVATEAAGEVIARMTPPPVSGCEAGKKGRADDERS